MSKPTAYTTTTSFEVPDQDTSSGGGFSVIFNHMEVQCQETISVEMAVAWIETLGLELFLDLFGSDEGSVSDKRRIRKVNRTGPSRLTRRQIRKVVKKVMADRKSNG